MSHARIEEVSDSDPEEGNISDISDDFDEREIIKQVSKGPRPSHVAPPSLTPGAPSATSSTRPGAITSQDPTQQYVTPQETAKFNNFQCLYPIYFDANRSRQEGRRVSKSLAVENPLAREIVGACTMLGLETLFEPTKIHPKDWANPGRAKIKLRGGRNPNIKNKHHLYTLISQHLKENPSTIETANKVRVPGIPMPDSSKPYPEPEVPKGWKMNKILPYYSPGLSGGGVSDNFLKDIMAEMQGAGGAGALPGAGAGGGMPDMSGLQNMMSMFGGGGGGAGAGAGSSASNNAGPKKEKKQKQKIIRA